MCILSVRDLAHWQKVLPLLWAWRSFGGCQVRWCWCSHQHCRVPYWIELHVIFFGHDCATYFMQPETLLKMFSIQNGEQCQSCVVKAHDRLCSMMRLLLRWCMYMADVTFQYHFHGQTYLKGHQENNSLTFANWDNCCDDTRVLICSTVWLPLHCSISFSLDLGDLLPPSRLEKCVSGSSLLLRFLAEEPLPEVWDPPRAAAKPRLGLLRDPSVGFDCAESLDSLLCNLFPLAST